MLVTATATGSARRDSLLRLLGDALTARVGLALFSLVSIFAVAHKVPVHTYGIYAAAMSFAMVLATFTDLGSSAAVVREGVAEPDDRTVGRTYMHVRFGLIVASSLVGAALVPIAFAPGARTAAYLSLLTVVFSGAPVIGPLGQVHGSMRPFRIAALLQGGTTLAATLGVVLLIAHPSAEALIGTNIVGAIVGSACALYATTTWTGNLLSTFDRERAWRMLRAISMLGIAAVATTAYARIDGILVLRISGGHASGLYSAAVRIVEQTAIIPTALMVPLSPRIAAVLGAGSRLPAALDRLLDRLCLRAGLGLALGTIGASYVGVALLLGPRFSESARLLCILAVAQAWVVVAYVSTAKVIFARLERQYIAITLLGLGINIVANLILIPPYGPTGAAYATVATELCTVVAYCWMARRVSGVSSWPSLLILLTVSSVSALAMMRAIPAGGLVLATASSGFIVAGLACAASGFGILRQGLPDAGAEH